VAKIPTLGHVELFAAALGFGGLVCEGLEGQLLIDSGLIL